MSPSHAAGATVPIVDIDSHWTEPPDLWASRAPAALRASAPRVEADAQGREQWVAADGLVLAPVGYCAVRRDGSKAVGRVTLDTFAEVHPGAVRADARLAWLDEHHIAAQVVYPNVLGFTGSLVMQIRDAELRRFCVTAYNDAAADLKRESGGRLLPQAVLPIWDVAAATAELVRSHDRLGLHGIVLPDAPEVWGLPTLSDPSWEPLWCEAEARGVPVNFHIGGGGPMGALWGGMSEAATIAALSSLADTSNIRCLVNLIFSGLLDHHPSLRFVSVESGLGWIPFVLELAEYQFDENGVTSLKLRPREYFRRQIYASWWFESDLGPALAALGEDNILFETDFPHPTCLYPEVRGRIARSLAGQPVRVQRKLLYETAAAIYGVPQALLDGSLAA